MILIRLDRIQSDQGMQSQWEALQTLVARLVNSELPGLIPGDVRCPNFFDTTIL